MSTYSVALLDKDGFGICLDLVDGLPAAKKRAKYLLSADHAKVIGSSHETLGTRKVEIAAEGSSVCIWDAFLPASRQLVEA